MKLRSIYLGTLPLLAVAMTACSSNEELARPDSKSDAINFSVVSDNMTRAANSYCNINKPSSFKVTAYYNISENGTSRTVNYYNGDIDELTSTDNGATYPATKVRYWPENGENLSFYACVDDGGTFTQPDELSGAPSPFVPQFKDFTVNNTVADQTDLMYAVAANVNAKSHDGKVPLNFRHALAQICFTAQNNSAYKDIQIKSIEVGGVSGKGTFKFPSESSNYGAYNHEESSIPEEGPYSGTWTDLSETTSYQLDLSESSVFLGAPDETTGIGEKKYISTPGAPNASSTSHANADFAKAMNLIPQYIQEGAYFKISMDVLLPGATAYTTPEPITIPIKNLSWNEGYRYVYNLIWSGDKVIYDVNFSDFNVTTPSDVDAGIVYEPVLMREASGDTPALYFADRNVGANSPEEVGQYFAWGSTYGLYYKNDMLVDAGGNSYNSSYFYEHMNDESSAYGKTFQQLYEKGFITSEDVYTAELTPEHDAATANIGNEWRMPKSEELVWLTKDENCEWKWCDGNSGTISFTTATAKGPNKINKYNVEGAFVKSITTGNIIFLPKSGIFTTRNEGNYNNGQGYYWSNQTSSNTEYAKHLMFAAPVSDDEASLIHMANVSDRSNGYAIRAVWKGASE